MHEHQHEKLTCCKGKYHEYQHEKLTCCKEQYQEAKYELKAHGAYPPLRIPQAPTPLNVKTMRIKLESSWNQIVSMRI